MKLEDDNEFHRLAMETILAMCMNDINGKRILKVEGFLSLTVESGEIFCVVIKEALDEAFDHEDGCFHPEDDDDGLPKMSTELNAAEENIETKSHVLQQTPLVDCDVSQRREEFEKHTDTDSALMSTSDITDVKLCSQGKEYVCSYCDKPFKTERGMERHMKAKHSAKVIVCPGCSDSFPEKDLISHLAVCTLNCLTIKKFQPQSNDPDGEQSSYDNSEIFEICPAEMWEEKLEENNLSSDMAELQVLPLPECTIDDTQKELKEETPDELNAYYRCPDCQSSFSTNLTFNQHMILQHGYSVFGEISTESIGGSKCDICGKVLRSDKLLLRHCQRLHKIEQCSQTGQSIYRCFSCSKVYPTYNQLKRHRSLNHRVKPFTCRDCNISFSTQGDQIYHRMRLHRKRTCNQCQLVFSGLLSFTEHVRSCHPGVPVYKVNKQFVCEFCSGTFADEKHLNDHIQSKHLGLVHMCEVCGKVLGTSETLRIHRKLHVVETYRTCDVCGKQFGRLSGLMEHMRSKHPENVPEKYRCSFKCHQCGIAFSRRHTLHRHVENKHDGKTFTCDVCGKIFHSKRYIIRHKKKHHTGVLPEAMNKFEAETPDDGYIVENTEMTASMSVLSNCNDDDKKEPIT